jgi:hypothetical protein
MTAGRARQPGLAGRMRSLHLVGMTGKDKEREERLAVALRENLRRRKAQARKISQDRPDKSD